MSREQWEARMREISEEIQRMEVHEAELVAEWHRLQYQLTQSNAPSELAWTGSFELDADSEGSSDSSWIAQELPAELTRRRLDAPVPARPAVRRPAN